MASKTRQLLLLDQSMLTGHFRKNLLINGSFNFWQRGLSTSAGGYCADAWWVSFGSRAVTASRQAFTLGSDGIPGMPLNFMRVDASAAGTDAVYFSQTLPKRLLFDVDMTLSFWAKSSVAGMKVGAAYVRPLGMTSVSLPFADQAELTTEWQRYSLTTRLDGIADYAPTVRDTMTLNIFLSDTGVDGAVPPQNAVFDFANVQFEVGDQATGYELLPYEYDLSLCRALFEKSYALDVAPGFAVPSGFVGTGCASMRQNVGPGAQDSLIVPVAYPGYVSTTLVFYNPVTGAADSVRNYTRGTDCAVGGGGHAGTPLCETEFFTTSAGSAAGDLIYFHYTMEKA